MISGRLRVMFGHVAGGLASRDARLLTWFKISDVDEVGFAKANARTVGATMALSAPAVNHPVAMRFAWHILAGLNPVDSAVLPAGAIRAGDVPKRDRLALEVPAAAQYPLVSDLDLTKLGPTIMYDGDYRAKIRLAFDRVAYVLENTFRKTADERITQLAVGVSLRVTNRFSVCLNSR